MAYPSAQMTPDTSLGPVLVIAAHSNPPCVDIAVGAVDAVFAVPVVDQI